MTIKKERPMPEKKRTDWSRIAAWSFAVSAVALIVSVTWRAEALDLMLGLFLFGAVAGWMSRRHGWLSGVIVGMPLAFFQMTRAAVLEAGSLSAALAQPD